MSIEKKIPHSSDPQEEISISALQNLQRNPLEGVGGFDIDKLGGITERYLLLSSLASGMEDVLIGNSTLSIEDCSALRKAMDILRSRTKEIDHEHHSLFLLMQSSEQK